MGIIERRRAAVNRAYRAEARQSGVPGAEENAIEALERAGINPETGVALTCYGTWALYGAGYGTVKDHVTEALGGFADDYDIDDDRRGLPGRHQRRAPGRRRTGPRRVLRPVLRERPRLRGLPVHGQPPRHPLHRRRRRPVDDRGKARPNHHVAHPRGQPARLPMDPLPPGSGSIAASQRDRTCPDHIS